MSEFDVIILGGGPGGYIAAERLAPLDDERPGSRARLLETLRSWLAHRGSRNAIGEELHIHPQTVGYRVGRLRELFGDALEDPDARFDLEIALRARREGVVPAE